MFLLNSRGARFAAAPSGYKPYRGTPSSEVTELICLVPERVFSQAPLDIHLVYLCRFGVRLRQRLLADFLGSVKSRTLPGSSLLARASESALNRPGGFACRTLLDACKAHVQ